MVTTTTTTAPGATVNLTNSKSEKMKSLFKSKPCTPLDLVQRIRYLLIFADQTPSSDAHDIKCEEKGKSSFPPGVLNLVSNYGPIVGATLASYMDVDKIAFAGSTETDKVTLELAAKSNLKPLALGLYKISNTLHLAEASKGYLINHECCGPNGL